MWVDYGVQIAPLTKFIYIMISEFVSCWIFLCFLIIFNYNKKLWNDCHYKLNYTTRFPTYLTWICCYCFIIAEKSQKWKDYYNSLKYVISVVGWCFQLLVLNCMLYVTNWKLCASWNCSLFIWISIKIQYTWN